MTYTYVDASQLIADIRRSIRPTTNTGAGLHRRLDTLDHAIADLHNAKTRPSANTSAWEDELTLSLDQTGNEYGREVRVIMCSDGQYEVGRTRPTQPYGHGDPNPIEDNEYIVVTGEELRAIIQAAMAVLR